MITPGYTVLLHSARDCVSVDRSLLIANKIIVILRTLPCV